MKFDIMKKQNLYLKEHNEQGPHLIRHQHLGINGRIAVAITNAVGTMWCAYLFALLALISLPIAVQGGIATTISWIAQTFLQLVLLSIIMVGQKVSAKASDKRTEQTFRDTEEILKLQDQIHRLTREVHRAVLKKKVIHR